MRVFALSDVHVNRDIVIDGVNYINNAFAYPHEERIAAKVLRCIYAPADKLGSVAKFAAKGFAQHFLRPTITITENDCVATSAD